MKPETMWGPGSLNELGVTCDALGTSRIMAVASKSVDHIVTRLPGLLSSRYLGRWSDVPAHVPAYQANLTVGSAQETHADAVLAIGGGSATGLAKIVALALRLPLIAVPTTYSGAEMTSRYHVTTGNGKETGTSERVLPDVVCYDSELTAALPPRVAASSGVAALAHCVQTLCQPDAPPDAADSAREGLLLLWDSLSKLAAGASDERCLQDALAGASLAGQALEQAGPGLQHVLCDVASTRLDIDFGVLHAAVLPRVLRAHGDSAAPARTALGELRPGVTAEQAIEEFCAGLGVGPDPGLLVRLPSVIDEVAAHPLARQRISADVIEALHATR